MQSLRFKRGFVISMPKKKSHKQHMQNKQLVTFFGLVASICPYCHLLFLQQLDINDHTYVCDAFVRCSKYSH